MSTAVRELEPEPAVLTPEPLSPISVVALQPPVRWRLTTRVAFRFFTIYFGLYILATQMFHSVVAWPFGRIPGLSENGTLRAVTSWVGTDVFGFPKPLTMISGSGDKPYDYAFVTLLFGVSLTATVLWSIVDRRSPAYIGFHKWFRLFLRFGLGGTMVTYGVVKVFPLQMSYPNLTRLLEPYGHFSLMGVLWAKIGASPAYEICTGLVELTAGILLFIPGLTTVGALLALFATTQIFALNMTYDVPVKLFSAHLVAMSLMLLAPEANRLFNVILLNRAAGPSMQPPLISSRRGQQIAAGVQLLLAAWIVGVAFYGAVRETRTRGVAAPKPPLYGIWNVERMTIDGVERAPLVTDYDRWRRLVIQTAGSVSFQRMDDTFSAFPAKVDASAKTIALTTSGPTPFTPAAPPASSIAQFTYEQPTSERLILDGEMNGKMTRMELQYYDRSNFRLVQGRFRWVQDLPFNR